MQSDLMARIRALQSARPFQPFVIVADDGTRLPVEREFQCAAPEQGLIYAQPDGHLVELPAKRVVGVVQAGEKPAA